MIERREGSDKVAIVNWDPRKENGWSRNREMSGKGQDHETLDSMQWFKMPAKKDGKWGKEAMRQPEGALGLDGPDRSWMTH